MTLPQEIRPINDQLANTHVGAGTTEWIEYEPGMAWIKVLWLGSETGTWAAQFRWKKGFAAPPHKHLSAAHVYVISGRLGVRDATLAAGDYVYEPNGVLHGATTALEDTEYLFICNGPVLFFDDEKFTQYLGWEELERMRRGELGRIEPTPQLSQA
jgi:quercetin dioxygenase-like cupin family protein